jgi:hypothetical protein
MSGQEVYGKISAPSTQFCCENTTAVANEIHYDKGQFKQM